jgi:hypothetical protein
VSVVYASPVLRGYATAVYFCRCGRTAARHGLDVRSLPHGWVAPDRVGDGEHLCPDCAPAPKPSR